MNKLTDRFTDFINSTNEAMNQGNWFGALAIVVTLPDICCRLDGTKQGNFSRDPYIHWFDTYVGERFRFSYGDNKELVIINGKNAYALRCAFLHDGSGNLLNHEARDLNLNIDKISFFLPEDKSPNAAGFWTEMQADAVDRELLLNVSHYCRYIISGVEKWLEVYKNDISVISRSENMVDIKHYSDYQK